jgi:hypothetical protein
MADEVESTPVKRGPGRPRKAAAEPVVEAPVLVEESAPAGAFDPGNPQVGQACDPAWTGVGCEGGFFRCKDGMITERVS